MVLLREVLGCYCFGRDDPSGNGTATAQVFATLSNKPQYLTAAQFVVI